MKARDLFKVKSADYCSLDTLPNSPQWMSRFSALRSLGLDFAGWCSLYAARWTWWVRCQNLWIDIARIFRNSLRELRIPSAGVEREESRLLIKFRDAAAQKAVVELARNFTDLELREIDTMQMTWVYWPPLSLKRIPVCSVLRYSKILRPCAIVSMN